MTTRILATDVNGAPLFTAENPGYVSGGAGGGSVSTTPLTPLHVRAVDASGNDLFTTTAPASVKTVDASGNQMFTSSNPGIVKISDGLARAAADVVTNDSTDLTTKPTKGLYIGTSGDVKVTLADGTSTVTFKNLAAGVIHPLSVVRVWATGTTATLIVAVY